MQCIIMLSKPISNSRIQYGITSRSKTNKTKRKQPDHFFSFFAGAWRCRPCTTSTFPLLCHVANNTPHLAQWWFASLSDDAKYGRHPRQQQKHRIAAHACVVFPDSMITCVISRWLHAGQSTGAGELWSAWRGVAVGYWELTGCWGGSCCVRMGVCVGWGYAWSGWMCVWSCWGWTYAWSGSMIMGVDGIAWGISVSR